MNKDMPQLILNDDLKLKAYYYHDLKTLIGYYRDTFYEMLYRTLIEQISIHSGVHYDAYELIEINDECGIYEHSYYDNVSSEELENIYNFRSLFYNDTIVGIIEIEGQEDTFVGYIRKYKDFWYITRCGLGGVNYIIIPLDYFKEVK